MNISKEEIMHIAELANLNIADNEIDSYVLNLQDILNFANIVNEENVDNLDITVGANKAENVFRKDEVKQFENIEGLLLNAPEKNQNMIKIPKTI